MSSLEKQLLEIKEEEIQIHLENPKLNKVKRVLSILSVVVGLLSFFIVVGFFYLVLTNIKIPKGWEVLFAMLVMYGGGFMIAGLYQVLSKGIKYLVHYFIRISQSEYNEKLGRLEEIRKRIIALEWGIKDELETKLKEQCKQKEILYIAKLNNAVATIRARRIPYENAQKLYTELRNEYAAIKILYYHTSRYYLNRLFKITSALSNYDSYDILDYFKKPQRSITNHSPQSLTDKPVTTETNKVVTTPSTQSILSKPTPIDTVKPSVKIETERPIVTAEADAIKLNASNTKETSITELFKEPEQKQIAPAKQKRERRTLKVDYKALNEWKHDIGKLGEFFALEWEKQRLDDSEIEFGNDNLVHVSLVNDGLGYDIKSINGDGTTRFIEVKTTTGSHKTPFFLSEKEIDFMASSKSFFIYRIYWFNVEEGTGAIFIIKGGDDLNRYYDIHPTGFRITPR